MQSGSCKGLEDRERGESDHPGMFAAQHYSLNPFRRLSM